MGPLPLVYGHVWFMCVGIHVFRMWVCYMSCTTMFTIVGYVIGQWVEGGALEERDHKLQAALTLHTAYPYIPACHCIFLHIPVTENKTS